MNDQEVIARAIYRATWATPAFDHAAERERKLAMDQALNVIAALRGRLLPQDICTLLPEVASREDVLAEVMRRYGP